MKSFTLFKSFFLSATLYWILVILITTCSCSISHTSMKKNKPQKHIKVMKQADRKIQDCFRN